MRALLLKSDNRILCLVKAAVSLAVIVAIFFSAASWPAKSATAGSADSHPATLTVYIRSTEPLSDTSHIFRLTTQDENDGQISVMRFVATGKKAASDELGIPAEESNNLQVYESTATFKLKYGLYRIEYPSDVRWRHGDLETCYNKEYVTAANAIIDAGGTIPEDNMIDVNGDGELDPHPDEKSFPSPYNILVLPHKAYAGYYNNRISFATSEDVNEVSVTINLVRVNERWLSYSDVTEGVTGK